MGKPVLRIGTQHALGKAGGLTHVTIRQRRDEGAFEQLAIARVEAQGLAEIGRGGKRIAIGAGDQRRQIVARRTDADLK